MFSEWLSVVHTSERNGGSVKQRRSIALADRSVSEIKPMPILQFSYPQVRPMLDPSECEMNDRIVSNMVKIELKDIQPEIDFWSSSVICYVIGANPPIHVMDGFVRRIWKSKGVDRVAMIKIGMYIVKFFAIDKRDEVLAQSMIFFDNKPFIVKAWEQDKDFFKEVVDVVPTWIQLRVDFKY